MAWEYEHNINEPGPLAYPIISLLASWELPRGKWRQLCGNSCGPFPSTAYSLSPGALPRLKCPLVILSTSRHIHFGGVGSYCVFTAPVCITAEWEHFKFVQIKLGGEGRTCPWSEIMQRRRRRNEMSLSWMLHWSAALVSHHHPYQPY